MDHPPYYINKHGWFSISKQWMWSSRWFYCRPSWLYVMIISCCHPVTSSWIWWRDIYSALHSCRNKNSDEILKETWIYIYIYTHTSSSSMDCFPAKSQLKWNDCYCLIGAEQQLNSSSSSRVIMEEGPSRREESYGALPGLMKWFIIIENLICTIDLFSIY